MASILRIRANLTGSCVVGPSVSTFYWDSAEVGGPAAIRAFYAALASYFHTSLSISVDGSGDILEDSDGSLVGTWSEATPAAVAGTSGVGFTYGVGARVKWRTSNVHNGRRTVGSTFLVPLSNGFYGGSGNLDDTMRAAIVTAGDTLRTATSSGMRIWSRPGKGLSDGESSQVTGVIVPDFISWLRSRRT